MTEFKVGDKVTHNVRGKAEVTYGPYTDTFGRTYNVIRLESGREVSVPADVLTALPAFAVGDTVTLRTRNGARATVKYGPFDDRDVYVVRLVDAPDGDDNPRTFAALANIMERVPTLVPVGTRVRVDRAKWAEEAHGTLGRVTGNSETWAPSGDVAHRYAVELDSGLSINAAEVTPVDEPADTFVHEGITYDLTAEYTDRDGDVWRFRSVNGEIRGDWGPPRESVGSDSYPISSAVHNWGPFTKI